MTSAFEVAGIAGIAGGQRLGVVDRGVEVDLAEGTSYEITWAPVPGATAAVVEAAEVRIRAVARERPRGTVTPTKRGNRFVLAFGGGGTRVRRLALTGLAGTAPGVPTGPTPGPFLAHLGSIADLRAADLRLVVAVADQTGQMVPRFSVPAVGAQGYVPAQLTGASFDGGVLTLPDVAATAIELSLVTGSSPNEFRDVAMVVEPIAVVEAELPRDATLAGADGAVIWQQPGELLLEQGTQIVDLRVAVQGALQRQVVAGKPAATTIVLKGGGGAVFATTPRLRGALVRAFPGVLRVELRGEPVALALPDPAPGAETPDAVTADVTARYLGVRLVPEESDDVPPPGSAVAGRIVGDAAVLREISPARLAGRALAAVGIVGRAPEPCELAVWPADGRRAAGRAGDSTAAPAPPPSSALAAPTALPVTPSRTIGVTWVTFPDAASGAAADERRVAPTALAVRANRGRFFWAEGERPGGRPLARLAVRDPDPGGRPLLAGGAPVASLSDARQPVLRLGTVSLPASAFAAGGRAPAGGPVLASELFLTVDVADLTLRYAR